jgi:uncharacterized membrane protein
MPAQAPPSDLVFEAVIRPHRSLSPRGLRVLLGVIVALSCITSSLFWLLGAWPVAGFSGVEVTAACLLLRMNALAARESEKLLLVPRALHIIRTDRHGHQVERTLDPAWLRVELEERPGRVPALLLSTRDRREEVATRLGEHEKRDLSRALSQALHRWRNPIFDHPEPAA